MAAFLGEIELRAPKIWGLEGAQAKFLFSEKSFLHGQKIWERFEVLSFLFRLNVWQL